ncbi:DUF3108 domain-containing protein [Aestuariivivens sediminicola]|uniref:DUF3108 domain-containing protein n=1 Tax=Aestuariivivens sediminicola TaxID=2913560 RepID=UPI001F5907B2|nr:DUF3108 domain-containing protein [Aestuariivivens sediminicola]
MKKKLVILLLVFVAQIGMAQTQFMKAKTEESAFGGGEWFKFKMSYSGFLKAGNATLTVKESLYDGKDVYHVTGKGWTTGMIKWFFKVRDRYESYFDRYTIRPYFFIRNIDEGGHTKDIEIEFDQENNKAFVNDKKHNKKSVFDTKPNIQDMVSTFYYLRNNLDTEKLKKGDEVRVDMFFDEENYGFKLRYLGEDEINTDFGTVEALKFRPYVMAGRVFKEEESLTLWVSKDKNKVPLRIKADLAVGSLRADLEAFKGLKHPFKIVVKR